MGIDGYRWGELTGIGKILFIGVLFFYSIFKFIEIGFDSGWSQV